MTKEYALGPSIPGERYPPGTTLGRYRIVERLHVGGMGTVYRALRTRDRRSVALKIPHSTTHGEVVTETDSRLRREASVGARIRHPDCVTVSGIERAGNVSFLVMEFLDGVDLARHLATSGSLSVASTLSVIAPVIRALAFVHGHGIIHMDVKPSNIMLVRDGLKEYARLLDFGIARTNDDPPVHLNPNAQHLGTLRYLSPEGIQRHGQVDPRSDQFSVGVVLYECLTGRLPFGDLAPDALLQAIHHGAYIPARDVRPEVPIELDAVIRRALRPRPEERYPIIETMGHEIDRLASPTAAQRGETRTKSSQDRTLQVKFRAGRRERE